MDGTKLNVLRQTLKDIRAAITEHPAYLKGTGEAPDDKSFATDRKTIETLKGRLSLALHALPELKSNLDSLDEQDQLAWRYPREQRFRMRQSIADRRKPVREVYELAVNNQAMLRDLEGAISRLSVLDVMETLAEASETVLKEIVAQHKGHYNALRDGSAIASNIPLAFVLAVLVAYLTALARKSAKRPAK